MSTYNHLMRSRLTESLFRSVVKYKISHNRNQELRSATRIQAVGLGFEPKDEVFLNPLQKWVIQFLEEVTMYGNLTKSKQNWGIFLIQNSRITWQPRQGLQLNHTGNTILEHMSEKFQLPNVHPIVASTQHIAFLDAKSKHRGTTTSL